MTDTIDKKVMIDYRDHILKMIYQRISELEGLTETERTDAQLKALQYVSAMIQDDDKFSYIFKEFELKTVQDYYDFFKVLVEEYNLGNNQVWFANTNDTKFTTCYSKERVHYDEKGIIFTEFSDGNMRLGDEDEIYYTPL